MGRCRAVSDHEGEQMTTISASASFTESVRRTLLTPRLRKDALTVVLVLVVEARERRIE